MARCLCALAGLMIVPALLPANEAQTTTNSLPDLSLEQLVNIEVTSVSKREQNLFDAPAAVSVLSNEDIRRSGATSIAEALRLVPGLNVAQANSSDWAISSRGFNNAFANKLLVLVDGRAVYNPLFSGVFWDFQQPLLEDVDRIEVIRGPGATLWGANAVNGVINVVTRSARETQGAFAYAAGGEPHQIMSGARYGGQIDADTYYRVYGSYQLDDDFEQPNGKSALDNWQGGQGGFRIDRYPQAGTHLTWQGDVAVNDLYDHTTDAYNVNTLGRWTRQYSDHGSFEAQAYYDRIYRDQPTAARYAIDTFDMSLQHNFDVGQRNNVVWGLGYRLIGNEIEQTAPYLAVINNEFTMQLFSAFVQDEFAIIPDKLTVSAGTKLEHNDVTGFEVQPSARAVFKPTENQTVWASVSRAVRTPDEIEDKNVITVPLGGPVAGPGGFYLPTLVSGKNLKSESLWAYELGYRIQPDKRVSIDLATFYNSYDTMIGYGTTTNYQAGFPIGVAEVPWVNHNRGHTWGGELSLTYTPFDAWRLMASYSLLQEDFANASFSTTPNDPEQQIMLRSTYDLTAKVQFDGQLRYVDRAPAVSEYITADVRVVYRPTKNLEFAVVGQNLFQPQHLEQPVIPFVRQADVPRGVYGKVSLRF